MPYLFSVVIHLIQRMAVIAHLLLVTSSTNDLEARTVLRAFMVISGTTELDSVGHLMASYLWLDHEMVECELLCSYKDSYACSNSAFPLSLV